ncbi:structural maintenance of chromosomes protein 6, partial [Pancytospora philotis]
MAVPTIASIELVNFMCHRNFAVSFTKMVSCVSGRNGSGKSAVMIALGVLFGQRAHALERGSSFKNLIRAGSNQALIRVTLNNHRWHCTAKYGPVITLEKRLRPTGSRLVYVVEGRAHDMSAQNMRDLLMAYGLRFENPLNFLTQEQSKRFLNLSNPAELYDFYYCGSEFKTINAEIEEGLARLEEMEGMIEQTNEAYERVGKELELKRGQLEFLCTDFEARLAELAVEEEAVRLAGLLEEHKQAWGGIRAAEDEIGAAEEQRRAAEDAIENVAFVEKSTAAVDAEIEGLELRKHGLANDCADYVKELEETESAIRRIKERSRAESLSSSIQEADRRCSQQTAELEQLEGELGKQLAIDAEKEKETNDKISKRRYALDQQIRFLKNNTRDSAVEEVLAEHRRVA